ncbi:uncharacterized protein CLUP02_06315 [Colletotrichum lupini]|uniref:Uncharacterized protein n=1 Tax=Colletotrichum lupini TaxID=145971 RepID=A0A9Q8SPS1_9PEZI|nr:uncharacterized protein CLUP02_06315 [Colletotrichum lupini]UQC80830.1 hypothetical protein CLUP02_06315 [Colletotrichum lupini]
MSQLGDSTSMLPFIAIGHQAHRYRTATGWHDLMSSQVKHSNPCPPPVPSRSCQRRQLVKKQYHRQLTFVGSSSISRQLSNSEVVNDPDARNTQTLLSPQMIPTSSYRLSTIAYRRCGAALSVVAKQPQQTRDSGQHCRDSDCTQPPIQTYGARWKNKESMEHPETGTRITEPRPQRSRLFSGAAVSKQEENPLRKTMKRRCAHCSMRLKRAAHAAPLRRTPATAHMDSQEAENSNRRRDTSSSGYVREADHLPSQDDAADASMERREREGYCKNDSCYISELSATEGGGILSVTHSVESGPKIQSKAKIID